MITNLVDANCLLFVLYVSIELIIFHTSPCLSIGSRYRDLSTPTSLILATCLPPSLRDRTRITSWRSIAVVAVKLLLCALHSTRCRLFPTNRNSRANKLDFEFMDILFREKMCVYDLKRCMIAASRCTKSNEECTLEYLLTQKLRIIFSSSCEMIIL